MLRRQGRIVKDTRCALAISTAQASSFTNHVHPHCRRFQGAVGTLAVQTDMVTLPMHGSEISIITLFGHGLCSHHPTGLTVCPLADGQPCTDRGCASSEVAK